MGANPAQNQLTFRCPGPRRKHIGVNHRWNYSRHRAFAFHVLRNRAIAAGHDPGPTYQVISFLKPFQGPAKLSIGWASIGNVGSIIQIEHQRTLENARRQPFKNRRTKVHRFALHQDYIRLFQ